MSLQALLDAGARHAPEYQGGLSNHLPMALVSLHSLGADAARLQAFCDHYAPRLQAAPPAVAWPSGDAWTGRFGQPEAWPAYRALFAEWMVAEGATEMLACVLPALMPGCGAAAFHGPIRVAAALRAGHAAEVADALAYWASRFVTLGPVPSDLGTVADPRMLLRRLQAVPSRKALIADRMVVAARNPALQAAVPRLLIDQHTLARLARLSAQAYAGSGNFTALHLVTACHAMRVLVPAIENPLPCLRWFWQAWATAVAAACLKRLPPASAQTWPTLVAAALASNDEHQIKLIDSCRAEETAYGGDDWRLAASRALAMPA